MLIRNIILICYSTLILACGNEHDFVLEELAITKNMTIDTLENYSPNNVSLVLIKDNGSLGEFKKRFAFVKRVDHSPPIVYEIKGGIIRITIESIALVNTNEKANFGWFPIVNGKILGEIPDINDVLTKVKSENQNNFIQENNGIFTLFNNGKIVKEINYGNFLPNYENYDFDSLGYGVYCLKESGLHKVSDDGNKLFEQNNGLYYIPSPGYGLVSMRSKERILSIIDSISKLKVKPMRLKI